jgi:DNA-binding transcriptional LysR family regulator
MDVRHLRAFVAVLDEGSFVAAAARLGVGRATLSERIRRLETEVGARLLIRTPASATLAGATFAPFARRILADADAAVHAVGRGAWRSTHLLRIGHLTSGAADLNAPFYAALRRALPEALLRVEEVSLADADNAVLEGRVDVAFLRDPVEDPRLDVVPLYATGRVAALAAEHALADRPALTVADLADIPVTAINRHQNPAMRRVYGLEEERNGGPSAGDGILHFRRGADQRPGRRRGRGAQRRVGTVPVCARHSVHSSDRRAAERTCRGMPPR